jgi:hypothetical protein
MDRDSDRARAARDDNDGGIGDRREREVNMPSPMREQSPQYQHTWLPGFPIGQSTGQRIKIPT